MRDHPTDEALDDRPLTLLLSDPAGAMALARDALHAAEASGSVAARCFAHLTVAQLGMRLPDYRAGTDHLQRAEELLPRHDHSRVHWLARHVHAAWLRREGRAEEALARLAELHAHADERPPLDAFYSVSLLGIAQGIAQQHPEALRSFYAALSLASRCDVPSIRANALNNLGSFQLDLYNLEDARPLLEACLEVALGVASRRQIIFAAGNLSQCLCALGLRTEALALVRRHLEPLLRDDDPPDLHRDEEFAQALIDNELWEEARARLARAPQVDLQTNEVSAARAWLEARLLMADGRPAAALARCQQQQARQAEEEDDSNMPLDLLRLAEVAASAAAAGRQYLVAYEQMSLAHAIQDRLLGRAARARFASLQIVHDIERMQHERDAAVVAARQLEALNATLKTQVDANQRLQHRLEALALEDTLTGLHNRRHLFRAGSALMDQARRQGSSLALAMIDLDHFKQVNDRHGHEGGDRVLKAFASLARGMVRGSDLCCRHGGEEFVVMLSACDLPAAERRLADLLESFVAEPVAGPNGEAIRSSFSAGLSALMPADKVLEDLLARADAALYEAKRLGRRRIEIARH